MIKWLSGYFLPLYFMVFLMSFRLKGVPLPSFEMFWETECPSGHQVLNMDKEPKVGSIGDSANVASPLE